MVKRGELTDQQWQRLQPLLPPPSPRHRGGRPRRDPRTIINGILWVVRTGAPWRDLPERYGPWSTVYGQFYRWQQQGLWNQILMALQQQADAEGQLDWQTHFVDGSVIRAHQHAAGAKRGRSSLQRKHSQW